MLQVGYEITASRTDSLSSFREESGQQFSIYSMATLKSVGAMRDAMRLKKTRGVA